MISAARPFRSPLKALRDARMPASVGIEFERSRLALEAALSDEAADLLAESLIELRVLGADAALLGAIVRRSSLLAPRLTGPGGLTAWLTAVREVAQQARHCTLALLESADEVLRHGSPAELLMWARLGLRHGQLQRSPVESEATLAHFELRSRESTLSVAAGGERVDLASSKARLSHYLRALFDVAPALLPVDQGRSTRRPFLSNLGLHLPEVSRALRGATARGWYDAAAAHAAAHLRHSSHRFERGTLRPIQLVLVGLLEDARVETLAARELPGLRRAWLGLHPQGPAQGDSFVALLLRLSRCLLDSSHVDPHPWIAKACRQFFDATDGGRRPELLTPPMLRDLASRLGHDIGQMRLQFNHRDYVVEPAYRDDNAHLWLPENEPAAQLVASADAVAMPPAGARPVPAGEAAAAAPLLARVQYPEWDRLIGDYRSAWCTVLEGRPPPADARALQAAIDQHRALLQRLQRVLRAGRLRERVKLRAQLRGDELDIDAAVRSAIDRRSQRSPGQKVHQRFERRERDVAALVLLDSSASTAHTLAAGARVLDLAREAALLTTLTLAQAGDRCAIHGFCSNGRHQVCYDAALDFGEAIDSGALARLAGVHSRWSTRMGAALRHATTRLAAEPQRRRLLLFVTDGEPHDIDIHDRRYLIEDARRAVLEALRRGVAVFCVTLDGAADDYVRAIFGSGNYRVLDRIESLPRVLPAMVLRLAR